MPRFLSVGLIIILSFLARALIASHKRLGVFCVGMSRFLISMIVFFSKVSACGVKSGDE